jgi:alpha-tubulin suppressor-like RCC1 family protein
MLELQPAPVVGLSGATALRVGMFHGCAQRAQDVLCWGANSYGELGRGDRVLSATPVAVSGLGAVRAIEAGGFASCALRTDGNSRHQVTIAAARSPRTQALTAAQQRC